MSELHVLGGAVDHIIASLSRFDQNNCKIMPDGQPEPVAQDLFIAVHTHNIQGLRQHGEVQEELWSFTVTISKRLHARPIDRIQDALYTVYSSSGLIEVGEAVKYAIQGSHNCVKRMNNKVSLVSPISNLVSKISYWQVPQLLNRTPKPSFRNEDWWHGTHDNPLRDFKDGFVGLSISMDFGDILKLTTISEETCI